MNKNTVLLRGIAKKEATLLRRYIIDSSSQILTLYILFALLYFGGKVFEVQFVNQSLSSIIVGFYLFTLAYLTFYRLAWNMMDEAQWGTLEQLYMSPLGFLHVISYQAVVNIFISWVFSTIVLLLMIVTSGRSLAVDFVTVVPIGLVVLLMAVSIAFAFGGLTILYTNVKNLFQFIQLVFIIFISIPNDYHPLIKILPFTVASDMLGRAMSTGIRIWEFPLSELGFLLGKTIVCVLAGVAMLQWCTKKAITRGVFGDH